MDCPPIPQFSIEFLLRSDTYLKERPAGTSIANREFPLPEDVVRLTLQGAVYTAVQWFTLVLCA